MAKLVNKRSRKAGLPPGSVVHVGERKAESVRITLIDYDEANYKQEEVVEIERCFELKTTPTVTWINIDGVHDTALIEKVGSHFGLHHLVQEDIVSTGQRPKFEDYEDYLFVVFRMLTYDRTKRAIDSEQVSLILGKNFVISFQERVGDVFEQVRERIKASKGRVRKMGCDYLVYSLIDATVDNYFTVLEQFGERIETLEEKLVTEPDEQTLNEIGDLKSEMLYLRKSIWPLREVINGLQKSESDLISDGTNIYFRDVYDHTIQIIDTIESLRDMVSGMLDIYLSSLSNRMNAVMKVLTIIATIFIPLSFFAGVYGMNFKYMPELEWKWAYPLGFWVFIIVVVCGMLVFFRRKKWL
jgi:magnesium transporter